MAWQRRTYPPIKQLPASALSIANYAKQENIQVFTVYQRFDSGKIKIVEFQGYNFVLPDGGEQPARKYNKAKVEKVVPVQKKESPKPAVKKISAPVKSTPASAKPVSDYLQQRRQMKFGVK